MRELLTEVEYRDPNGQVQTAAATVALWPAALVPGIKVENWAGTQESVKATVVALDVAGKPVADAPVQVDVFQRQLYSTRKRPVGGFTPTSTSRTHIVLTVLLRQDQRRRRSAVQRRAAQRWRAAPAGDGD